MPQGLEFSVITPTAGRRLKGLDRAIASVEAALAAAGDRLATPGLEMLIGFDGVKGLRPSRLPAFVRCLDLPLDNDWGNGIRPILLKAARGRRVLFLDDDNQLSPQALNIYLDHAACELVIGRIDTSQAFADRPYLPQAAEGQSLVRQGNVDPLCLCATRELVVDRCGSWRHTGYPADYLNIITFYRRAKSLAVVEDVVGLYDAGRGLDPEEGGDRRMLHHEAGKRPEKAVFAPFAPRDLTAPGK
jgi:hypothetical protein